MKIVNRNEFLKLPPGTIAMKYQPCVFGEIFIKEETIGESGDFFLQYPLTCTQSETTVEEVGLLFDAQENKTSLKMDFDCSQRDGCFDEKQLFAVYEKTDLEGLIKRLNDCLVC